MGGRERVTEVDRRFKTRIRETGGGDEGEEHQREKRERWGRRKKEHPSSCSEARLPSSLPARRLSLAQDLTSSGAHYLLRFCW